MKREYFGMLFIIISVVLIIGADYIFGDDVVQENLSRFIVIWILAGFYAGQYSMKFPKAF
ncbi:hypothetical protein FLAN108750_01905 [Flavobacterium antarcticum]|uniref:hypothetical protein n=1 Tax=Flavobacterium antarcticum TaxID=271155 RepID=UPI0003B4C2ED|nr:hypothetical protein [Flavobacterium antarcticum]